MPHRFTPFFAIVFLLFFSLLATSTPFAQTITLGGDDNLIYRVLRDNGYTQGRIVKRKLTIVRTEACKGREKFLVKISILGRITSTSKIGRCEPAPQNASRFSPQDAVAQLQQDGFAEITAEQTGRRVTATACRQNRRLELVFNRRGQIINQRDIGSCLAVGLSREQIADLLKSEGFQRIVVTDDRLPKYVAEACRNTSRVRVTLNRRGRIRSERRIGDCGRQFNKDNLTTMLERNGYDRVKIVDNRRPPYVARACKGEDRMEVEIGRYGRVLRQQRIRSCRTQIDPQNVATILEKEGFDRVRVVRGNNPPYLVEACRGDELNELTIGRFGRIQRTDRVGTCARPITEVALQEKLSTQGFLNLSLTRQRYGWRAEVCRNEAKLEIRIDAYGDIIRERNVGQCLSKSVLDILKNLEGRGADRTSLQVIGCFRNSKYRWSFDRLGNRVGRDQLGRC